MIQALAAFSGGLWVQNKLSDLQLPQLSRRINEAESFKLSVQVVAASIPGLTDSGLLTRERPRVAALLNGVRKETEFGDCNPDENDLLALPGTDNLPPCDWHFNETLTFAVTVADVLAGQSVQLWIHTYSDVRFGPFQVNLTRARDIGVCSVELQKQVLPDCVPSEESGDSTRHQETPRKRGSYSWETPVLPFPLTHVGDSKGSAGNFVLGQAAGHLLVKFSMNADPQAILQRAESASRPLVERVADPFRQMIAAPVRWVEAASEVANCDGADLYCGVGRGYRESDGSPLGTPILSDLPADGWVKHQGPDGRLFWQHLSLGPPPWDRAVSSRMNERSPININGCVAGTEEDAVLRLPSKEKPILKEGTQIFNLDLNKGAESGGGTSSQPLARRSSRSLEAMAPPHVAAPPDSRNLEASQNGTGSVGLGSASQTTPARVRTFVTSQGSQVQLTGSQSTSMYRVLRPPPTDSQLPTAAGAPAMPVAPVAVPVQRSATVLRQPTAHVIRPQTQPSTLSSTVPVVRTGAEGSFVTVRPARASFAGQVPSTMGAPTRASFA